MIDTIINFILNLIHALYQLPDLIGWGGYLILFLIVFAETGLFFGFFLPGDSLLITAGLFAAGGKLNILILIPSLIAAAIVGDTIGYWSGHRFGKHLFKRKKSRIFKKKHLLKAKAFYEKHGGKTIVIARFMPLIRTFAPIVAGATDMPYKKFAYFNVIGGVLWVLSMTLIGYFIGSAVPDIEKNIGLLVIAVVAVSFIPGIIEYLRQKKEDKEVPVPA